MAAVVAATGRTGLWAVEHLRSRGVSVIAIGRSRGKLEELFGGKEGVEIRVAEMHDAAALERALTGATVVLATAGYILGSGATDIYTTTARNVTATMEKLGIRRLVWMGSSGVFQPEDRPPAAFSCLLCFFRYAVCGGAIMDDQSEALDILREHSATVDWVYVRPDTLTDGEGGEALVHGFMGRDIELRPIARKDVARFMVEQALDPHGALVHQAHCIAPAS